MKASDEQTASRVNALREFSLILSGYACFEALYCATKLDLFTLLSASPGLTQREIQNRLKLQAQPARVLLMSCMALKLIYPEGKGFINAPIAEVYLSRKSSKNLIAVIEAHHEIVYRPMFHLHESLKKGRNRGLQVFPGKGQTLYSRLAGFPKQEKIFHQWMKNIGSEIDVERHCFPLIGDRLGQLNHIVDMGGGDGANAKILLKMFPHLQVTIFDHPTVCAMAKKRFRKSPYADRIHFKPGDFFKDALPKGVDGVFFSHIFNIYSAKKNIGLLRKCRQALPRGGSVIVFNSVVLEETEPSISAAHLSMYFMTLATGQGMVHPLADYDGWFNKAGFSKIKKVPMVNYQKAFVIGTK